MRFVLKHDQLEPFQLNGQIQLPTGEKLNWELSGEYVLPKERQGTHEPKRLYNLLLTATLNEHPVRLWYYDYEERSTNEKIWFEGQTDEIKPYAITLYVDLTYYRKQRKLEIDLRLVQSILIR